MAKHVISERLFVAFLASMLASSVSMLSAQQASEPMNYDGQPGGLRLLEEGQPAAMVHATVDAMEKFRAANPNANEHARQNQGVQQAGSSSNLSYHGGAVETAPKVYLVLWGPGWSNDPSGEATLLQNFLNGVSGSSWLNSVTQYCQGVASGTVFCSGGTPASNVTGAVNVWADPSSAPTHPRQSQLAQEAIRAAVHFGNTTGPSNASVQYVIATAHGSNSTGFGTQYCAWHSSTSSTSGTIAYTNLPYITDAGASCGANFNGLGAKAGITIVEGHELAETITDQFPNGGWLDSSGAENGDKCAWISSGAGASTTITLNGVNYPVQSLWSNATSSCVISYP
jgi:hypothetical protein